jgi:hypothetical protein
MFRVGESGSAGFGAASGELLEVRLRRPPRVASWESLPIPATWADAMAHNISTIVDVSDASLQAVGVGQWGTRGELAWDVKEWD